MVEYDYQAALQAARQELGQLIQQREVISIRIMQLERTVQGLATLAGQTQIAQQSFRMDLTDAIVIALRNAAQPMSAVEIRDMLVAMGVQFARFSNPMAALHNALRRLLQKGLIIEFTGGRWSIAA
jgi:hypothetical protein